MTLQEIVSHRVADITFSLLATPKYEMLHKTNLEFLGWLEGKFGDEFDEARRMIFRGEIKPHTHKLPTRDEYRNRRCNGHRWQFPRRKK